MGIIAIDGGGTKTVGILSRTDGTVLSTANGGPSNMNGNRDEALRQLTGVVRRLYEEAEQSGEAIEALFAGLAGIEQGDNRKQAAAHLRRLYPDISSVQVDNDAITALYSGTKGEPGIVQIAGTGSITYGLHPSGRRERVGGWGYIAGDPGSGYSIGREALIAVLRAWDGLGKPTALTELIIDAYNLSALTELIPIIYAQETRQRVAALAPLVMKAADLGDVAAQGIMDAAAYSMGEAIAGLHRKLYDGKLCAPNGAVPVVLTGGIFKRADLLLPALESTCHEHQLQAQFILPDSPPIAGALFAALRQLGASLDGELCGRVDQQLAVTLG